MSAEKYREEIQHIADMLGVWDLRERLQEVITELLERALAEQREAIAQEIEEYAKSDPYKSADHHGWAARAYYVAGCIARRSGKEKS